MKLYQKNNIFQFFAKKNTQAMDEVNSFAISQILGSLRVSGMGYYAQKCEKLPMSLHPNDNFQLTLK
jgi:hypothetical protein